MSAGPAWWEKAELPEGEWAFRSIGRLRLWICRTAEEWRIAWRREDEPTAGEGEDGAGEGENEAEEAAGPPEDAALERVAGPTAPGLQLLPHLGDRAIVVHPRDPFRIPTGREVGLFVSFPVWVRGTEPEAGTLLLDVATSPLSSTWLGASTMEGELCYAAQLQPRLHLEKLERTNHRAFGKVVVHNQGPDDFRPDRLVLPAPSLNLYTDPGGQLWAQQVSVVRAASGTDVTVALDDGPPPECQEPQLLVSNPEASPTNMLARALGSLFG